VKYPVGENLRYFSFASIEFERRARHGFLRPHDLRTPSPDWPEKVQAIRRISPPDTLHRFHERHNQPEDPSIRTVARMIIRSSALSRPGDDHFSPKTSHYHQLGLQNVAVAFVRQVHTRFSPRNHLFCAAEKSVAPLFFRPASANTSSR